MRISGPFVTSGVLEGLDAFLRPRGVTLPSIITSTGLSYGDIEPWFANELPLVDVISILEAAATMTRSPCLGCEWGDAFPVGATGTYGYLLMNAPTLEDALRITAHYLSLVVHPVSIELSANESCATLSWYISSSLRGQATQYILFATAATVARLRWIAGGSWNPDLVELSCPELPCKSIMERILGPAVVFGTAQTRIAINKATLGNVNASADPRLFALMSELADRQLLERASETKLTQITRRAIAGRLGASEVSLETIAAALKISPRKLQSRLAAEGTSFETVLQSTKQRLAETYLRDTDLPLTEIAQMLGFSELSAFTRASLRWFKKPPSTLRQQLRPLPVNEPAPKSN